MDFQLLGPFEARDDDQPVAVRWRRQERLLLAILLLHGGQLVTIDRLTDLLWGSDAPDSARGAVHTYVGRLRRSLAPYGVDISTRPGGYLLDAEPHGVDAIAFGVEVREAASIVDPAERVEHYQRALQRWRGPLLADLADDRLRDRLDGGLTELRLATTEVLAEERLRMGRDDQVVTELGPLVKEHPTRERLVGGLMTALYRCGRRGDALDQYHHTRAVLADELGIDPGPALTRVYERVLRDDSRLVRPPAPVYAVRVRDHWLPWSAGGHPALEFCNTYAGWNTTRAQAGSEWLATYPALAVWAGHMDLADEDTVTSLLGGAQRAPETAGIVLAQAHELRASLYRSLTKPHDRDAFAAVAEMAQAAAARSVYTLTADGLGRWVLPPSTGLRLPLYAAATQAAELLSDVRRLTVRQCPSDHCGWLFLDHTGMRKWCSTATCGRALTDTTC